MTATGTQTVLIELDRLIPTPDNPRRIDHASPALAELAASIKARGQLQAGIARPHPQQAGKYDLRAGCRRWHACRLAGLESMLVSILDMTDAEAMEITVLENLQRSDLSPMEEASGVQALIDTGHPLEVIAADIGKPMSWVVRRARLTKLSPRWQEYAADKAVPAAHLELIARFSQDVQERLFASGNYERERLTHGSNSLNALRDRLADIMRTLKLAPWDVDDATLVPKAGACSACQKRSSCSPMLFDPDDFAGKTATPADDQCLDEACWSAKGAALKKRNGAILAVQYPNAIKVGSQDSWRYQHGTLGAEKPEAAKGEYTIVAEGKKGAIPALMIDGDQKGAIVFVVLKGEKAEKQQKAEQAKAEGKPVTPLAERREGLELRRKALAIERLRESLDKVKMPSHWTDADVIRLVSVFGVDLRNDHASPRDWDTLRKARTADLMEVTSGVLSDLLMPIFRSRLVIYQTSQAATTWNEAVQIAKLLYIPLEKIKRDADAEIPEPKSWAKEASANPSSTAKAAKSPKAGTAGPKATKPDGGRSARPADAGRDETITVGLVGGKVAVKARK